MEPEDPVHFSPTALAIDPDDPNRLLVSVTEDFYASTQVLVSTEEDENGHRIWRLQYELPGGGCVCKSINFSMFGIYMAFYAVNRPDEQFVVLSDAEGYGEFLPEWGEQPGDKRAWSIAVDPRNDANIYIGTEHMLYRSEDWGFSVQPFVEGANIISTVKRVDADLPNIHFMADQPPFGSIYRSTNYGQNWSVRKPEGIVTSTFIHSDPGQAGLCFASSSTEDEFGIVYRSTDDSETWSLPQGWPEGGYNGPVSCLAADPTIGSDWLYFGISSGADRGFYRSDDNGDTRIRYSYNPPLDANPLDIAIHPTEPATIIVADGSNGLFRTLNRGDDGFTAISNGLPGPGANKIKYCPGQPNMGLAATPSGIYKSINLDQTSPSWSASNYGGYVGIIEDMDFHSTDNSVVCFYASDIGLGRFFISADTARSWIELNSGLNGHDLYDISLDVANPDTFYVATNGGVYKLKNPVKSGLLTADAIWGPGTVIVNGDVTVPAGLTLTVQPGTEIMFTYDFDRTDGGASSSKSELIVLGTLNANGAGNPITFISSKPTDPGPGDWYGIRALASSDVNLDNCIIKHAEFGVFSTYASTMMVTNCTIKDNLTSGIHMDNAAEGTRIENTRIEDSGTYGIYCFEGSFTASGDTIANNRYGIKYFGDGNVTIEDCLITYPSPSAISSYYGIHVRKYFAMGPTPQVLGDSITGFDQGGIYFDGVTNASSMISATSVYKSGKSGIYFKNSSADISGGIGTRNFLKENGYGLYLRSSSSPKVRRTKFEDNSSKGALVNAGSFPDFGTMPDPGNNSFIKNGFIGNYKHLYNYNILPIDAIYNYWYPLHGSLIVNANYFPPLASDPLPKLIPGWDRPELAQDFELAKAYPNPFNPMTIISFNLSSPEFVTVKVFNIMGQEVRTVFSGHGSAGENSIVWNGKNHKGESVSAGVYLVQLRTSERQRTIKTTVLK